MRYEDAVIFTEKRRKIEPPVYNGKRLDEMPIPNIDQQMDNSNYSSENEFDELNGDYNVDDNGPEDEANESQENISAVETLSETGADEAQTNNSVGQINFESQIDLADANFLHEAGSELEADPLLISTDDVKLENDAIDIHNENTDALEELLLNEVNNPTTDGSIIEDEYDDDVVIFIGPDGLPKPKILDPIANLVKRENDIVTGNIPFNEVVNTIFLIL